MSPIAFRVLADLAQGRLLGVQWDWTTSAPGPAKRGLDGLGTASQPEYAGRSERMIKRNIGSMMTN
jgi:hypothetical protein